VLVVRFRPEQSRTSFTKRQPTMVGVFLWTLQSLCPVYFRNPSVMNEFRTLTSPAYTGGGSILVPSSAGSDGSPCFRRCCIPFHAATPSVRPAAPPAMMGQQPGNFLLQHRLMLSPPRLRMPRGFPLPLLQDLADRPTWQQPLRTLEELD
jgi:hypothetical protein